MLGIIDLKKLIFLFNLLLSGDISFLMSSVIECCTFREIRLLATIKHKASLYFVDHYLLCFTLMSNIQSPLPVIQKYDPVSFCVKMNSSYSMFQFLFFNLLRMYYVPESYSSFVYKIPFIFIDHLWKLMKVSLFDFALLNSLLIIIPFFIENK